MAELNRSGYFLPGAREKTNTGKFKAPEDGSDSKSEWWVPCDLLHVASPAHHTKCGCVLFCRPAVLLEVKDQVLAMSALGGCIWYLRRLLLDEVRLASAAGQSLCVCVCAVADVLWVGVRS